MDGWRRMLAVGIVAALGTVVIAATIAERGTDHMTVTTTAARVATTQVPPATPMTPSTTTTVVVSREEELEQLIGDMYWAWFDGVHRRDMAMIETIAGTEMVIDWAIGAFETVQFTAEPSREAIEVEVRKVLLDRPDCLVVSADVDYRGFLGDEVHSTVDVYFPVGDGWGFARKYLYEREMWQADCDHLARRSG